MHDLAPIIILGACGFLGREIARLSVALTHPTLGVDLLPALSHEPWTHGVQWHQADALVLDAWSHLITPQTRIIAALGAHTYLLTPKLTHGLNRHGHLRLVLASDTLPALPLLVDVDACALLLPPLWNEDHPWPGAEPSDPATWPAPHTALRQELAAMAALRVALEPQHHGTLTADEIAHLGDAMMLQ